MEGVKVSQLTATVLRSKNIPCAVILDFLKYYSFTGVANKFQIMILDACI